MNNTIFCRTCGKELSSEAFMCPNCGTPIQSAPAEKQPQPAEPVKAVTGTGANATGLSIVAFILATIAFVTGIIFGAFFYVFNFSSMLLSVISATSILPALAGLVIAAYQLYAARSELTSTAKSLSVVSVVFAVIVLLFLFLTGCIIASDTFYYYI